MDGDQPPTRRRTTVAEAAEILGISAEAVRGRIRRGTLPVEREGGTVYVLIGDAETDRTTTDQSRTTTDQPGDRTELLIAELQDRVRSLEEANQENRRIIAMLTSRIPEIEAPPEARESPENRSGIPTPTDAGEGPQSGAEPTQRRAWLWWWVAWLLLLVVLAPAMWLIINLF